MEPWILVAALVLDLGLGDPVYPLHPVRLMGRLVSRTEAWLLPWGRWGGGLLLLGGALPLAALGWALERGTGVWLGAVQLFLCYSLLGLGDLLRHGWAVRTALVAQDLEGARAAVSNLVGRDTKDMTPGAVARATVESLAENLCDGFVAPLFWALLLGLPGLLVFKWVSTLDSMIGYKNEKYRHFGFAAAKTDDLLNWLPARLTWALLVLAACFFPGASPGGAFVVGLKEHHKLPSPNSGWPEGAAAGALGVRLLGPITRKGVLENHPYLGDPDHPSELKPWAILHLSVMCLWVWFFCVLAVSLYSYQIGPIL